MHNTRKEKLIDKFSLLYGSHNAYEYYKIYINKLKKITILCVVVMIIVAIISFVYPHSEDTYITTLERSDYGKGKKNVSVIANIEGTNKEETLNIVVDERKYTDDELNCFADELENSILNIILANNSSADEVTTNLNLITHVNDYPFDISWKSEKPLLINNKGELDTKKINNALSEKNVNSIPISLCATLSYDKYTRNIYSYICVRNKTVKSYEDYLYDLNTSIEQKGNESTNLKYQQLPDEVNGIPVTFRIKKNSQTIMIIILGLLCSFLLILGQQKEIDKKVTLRNNELENDYSKILNQYALYYRAGMNTRIIWMKICEDYEHRIMEGGKKRYAYEEMLITRQAILDGTGEIKAYEDFAKRCTNLRYRTFVNLIEQSVVMGHGSLDELLTRELEKIRKDDLNKIRMSVQEMSTKLLFPMMLMLIIVIIVVMVPAFLSFSQS